MKLLVLRGGHFPRAQEQKQNVPSVLEEWHTSDSLLRGKGKRELDNVPQAQPLFKDLHCFYVHVSDGGSQRERREG